MLAPGDDASGDRATVTVESLTDLSGNVAETDVVVSLELLSDSSMFDFESSGQGWTTSGVGWEWGAPTAGPESGFESDNCWAVGLNGPCGDNQVGSLTSPLLLVCEEEPVLSYRCWYNLDHYDDYVYVRVITEEGGLTMLNSSTSYQTSWSHRSHNLSSFAGQVVRIQFHFVSDGTQNSVGYFVDNVSLGCD